MRETIDWKYESTKFDEIADIYDKYRPSYPPELIDNIISISGINKDSIILEIGAGSGKATELFVDKGYRLNCVEPGENLARIGSSRFKESGRVIYIVGRFEELGSFKPIYGLAISAQAFHWVPKPIGYQKLAEALVDDGFVGLFWNIYERYDDQYINELANVCKEYGVLYMEDRNEIDVRINRIKDEIAESRLFSDVQVFEYPWEIEDTYIDFMNFISTGNGYMGMNEENRIELSKKIRDIYDKASGKINRRLNCILFMTQKLKVG